MRRVESHKSSAAQLFAARAHASPWSNHWSGGYCFLLTYVLFMKKKQMACWLCAHHKINVSLWYFGCPLYNYTHCTTILQHESVLSIILPDEATGKSIDLKWSIIKTYHTVSDTIPCWSWRLQRWRRWLFPEPPVTRDCAPHCTLLPVQLKFTAGLTLGT